MEKFKNIYLFIIGSVLIFNIHLHDCHEQHDEFKLKTSSIPEKHECVNTIACIACTTGNVYYLQGKLIKTKSSFKLSQKSPIFHNQHIKYNAKAPLLFPKIYKKFKGAFFNKFITNVVVRQ